MDRKALTIAPVIAAASQATTGCSENRRAFLEQIARFAEPREGGSSDPSRETLLNYDKALTTRCGHRFASLVLEFLYVQTARAKVVDPNAAQEARILCLSVLRDDSVRKVRYERPPPSDPSSVSIVKGSVGVYVVVRRETGDRSLRQELLVLTREGGGTVRTYAVYVSPEVVCRGTWSVIQKTVCCTMHGQRKGFQADIINVHMARDMQAAVGATAILGGVLSGISSLEFLPTVLPVIAIRLPDEEVSGAMPRLGDACDAEIRSAYGKLDYKMKQVDFIERILENALLSNKNVIIPNTITADIRRSYSEPENLINASVLEFCRSYSE